MADEIPPNPANIPDLKKVAESKPAPFQWSPGAKIAKSAANVSIGTNSATTWEKLNSTPGRLAALALLMLMGGGVLSVGAFTDGSALASKVAEMAGLKSTIKNRPFYREDGTRLSRGTDDSQAPLKRPGQAGGGGATNMPGIPTTPDIIINGGEGGAPMNMDGGPTQRNGGATSGSPGDGPGKDGLAKAGGASGSGGFAAPKLGGGAYGSVKFQGMRRVSGTSGFRSIQGRGAPSRTINNRGNSVNNNEASKTTTGSRQAGSGLTPFNTGGTGGSLAGGDSGGGKDSASGGGGGGGSSGGGGSDVNTDGLDDIENAVPTLPDLMAKAAQKREDADDEKKKFHILMAAGQHPQAAYHYDRYKKKTKEAENYESQANQQTQMMNDTAAGMTKPKDP